MSIEDCSERPEMGDTNEVNEDSAPVPAPNDYRLVIFRWPLMTCVLRIFSLAQKYLYIQTFLLVQAVIFINESSIAWDQNRKVQPRNELYL